MSAWRHEAFERFPEFRTEFQEFDSPYAYRIELQFAFAEAYRKGDIDLFKRILDYADWCIEQPRGKTAEDDLATCVFCCFLEHMPQISADKEIDRIVLGREILANLPTTTHPHVRALLQNLVDRKEENKTEGQE